MMIIGHRGAKGEYPENTLGSFEYALQQRVGGVELDIHLSLDEELIVIHDETLDRTTNQKGAVLSLSSKDIKQADAGSGEKVPLLEEVFDLFKGKTQEIMVEIKSFGCEKKILKLISQFKNEDQIIIKSFNHRVLQTIRSHNKAIRIFPLLYGLVLDPISIIKSIDGQGLSISIQTVDDQLIKLCHQKSYKTAVWNANNKDQLEQLKSWSVDYICTDFPSLIKL